MQQVELEGKSYTVSFEAMPEALKKQLPGEELTKYLELLAAVQQTPKAVYKEIKEFGLKHETVPEVINLLTFAHIQNHRIVEAEKLIQETYEKYPHYLFARINYADQCIRKKKLETVDSIFPTLDLNELCPERDTFHTSEFRGFCIFMAYYHLAKKDKERALLYCMKAKEVDPTHQGVLYLEKKLTKKGLLFRLFGKK